MARRSLFKRDINSLKIDILFLAKGQPTKPCRWWRPSSGALEKGMEDRSFNLSPVPCSPVPCRDTPSDFILVLKISNERRPPSASSLTSSDVYRPSLFPRRQMRYARFKRERYVGNDEYWCIAYPCQLLHSNLTFQSNELLRFCNGKISIRDTTRQRVLIDDFLPDE